jgi:methionyl-tRNA formyltransferase
VSSLHGPGSLRIVFFGTPEFATPSLHALIGSDHQVVAVVSQPDRPKGRGHQVQATPTKLVAQTHGIPVIQPVKIKDESFHQAIRDLTPDLGVVVAFGRILPDALLAIPRMGMINVHASLLPRYRGAAPIQRAVLAGDEEAGVTIMRVITEMDAGPTFAMAAVPIPPDATSGEMEGPLAQLGARLLVPVIDDLAAGRAVETPQDASLATHAAKITKAEGVIDWTQPSAAVHNKVRGLQPWPLASTHLAGHRLVLRRTTPGVRSPIRQDPGVRSPIRRSPDQVSAERLNGDLTRPDEQIGDLTPALAASADLTPEPGPGTVVRAHGDELIVACGQGTAIRILEIQPEGRRTMTAREFLAGRGVAEGARFEP